MRNIKILDTHGRPMVQSFTGASHHSQELALFQPENYDIDEAIESDGSTLNSRAKDLVRNNADISGGVDQSNATVIGSKYRFNCKANYKILGVDEDDAKEWNFNVESLTSSYLNNSNNYIDAQRKRNFVQILSHVNTSQLIYGDVFFSREFVMNRTGIGTCFMMIDPERVETPMNKKAVMGVATNKYGAAVGYYIRNRKKQDDYSYLDTYKYHRKFTEFGQQIYHIFDPKFADQTRGYSKFAPIIKDAFMLDLFKDAELKSKTLVNQFMVYLTSDVGVDALKALDLDGFETLFSQAVQQRADYHDGANLSVAGNKIPALYNGDKINMLNPEAKASDLSNFERSILRGISKQFSQSYAQFSGDYTQQNRASTDASKAEGWKQTKYLRSTMINKAADYILWGLVDELVLTDKIKVPKGVDYFKHKEFLLNGYWIGEGKGISNEMANAQATEIYLATGQMTLEEVRAESGKGDVADAIEQRASEIKQFKDKGVDLPRTYTNKNDTDD